MATTPASAVVGRASDSEDVVLDAAAMRPSALRANTWWPRPSPRTGFVAILPLLLLPLLLPSPLYLLLPWFLALLLALLPTPALVRALGEL